MPPFLCRTEKPSSFTSYSSSLFNPPRSVIYGRKARRRQTNGKIKIFEFENEDFFSKLNHGETGVGRVSFCSWGRILIIPKWMDRLDSRRCPRCATERKRTSEDEPRASNEPPQWPPATKYPPPFPMPISQDYTP